MEIADIAVRSSVKHGARSGRGDGSILSLFTISICTIVSRFPDLDGGSNAANKRFTVFRPSANQVS